MTGTRVTVHRIDADPVDVPQGPAFTRMVAHRPSTDASEWRRIMDFLPTERLRTHVTLNQDSWPSSSDLLCAIADCAATSLLLERLPDDGWIDLEAEWREAQLADQERADAEEDTILRWRRPLVRLGALIGIHATDPLPSDIAARMSAILGSILVLEHDETHIAFVVSGMHQDVEEGIGVALASATRGPTAGVEHVSGIDGEKT